MKHRRWSEALIYLALGLCLFLFRGAFTRYSLLVWGAALALVLLLRVAITKATWRAIILKIYAIAPGGQSGELRTSIRAYCIIIPLSVFLGLLLYTDLIQSHYRRLAVAYQNADLLGEIYATETGANWPLPMTEKRATWRDRGCQALSLPLVRSIVPAKLAAPCLQDNSADANAGINSGSVPIKQRERLTLTHLFVLLRHYGLLDPNDNSPEKLALPQSPNNLIAILLDPPPSAADKNASVNQQIDFSKGDPTIDLILMLANYRGTSKCDACPETCFTYQRRALAAALAQQPSYDKPGQTVGETLRQSDPVRVPGNTPCAQLLQVSSAHFGENLGFWDAAIFERPQPELTSQELTELVLDWHGGLRTPFDSYGTPSTPSGGWSNFVQEQAVLRLMSVLLSELRGTEAVRAERRWVNALIGWERCFVFVLASAFSLFALWRYIQGVPHEIHRAIIVEELDSWRRLWVKNGTRPGAVQRRERAKRLYDLLRLGMKPTDSLPIESSKKQVIVTIPLRILEAATDEMQFWQSGGKAPVDSRFIETVAEGERRKLERSRIVFDIMLPSFPAIGFIGTVSSLLIAMSQADKIVKTGESIAKGIAASQVTDILSLCFSTTLMALLCVLVFSPISILQASEEQRLIDDVEDGVQTIIRPEQQ